VSSDGYDSRTAGFTIIELLFAMAVFSALMLAAASSLIQVGRMYYKGVTISRTQNLTRQIIDELSRPIQFSGDEPTVPVPITGLNRDTTINSYGTNPPSSITTYSFCIGTIRYSYVLDRQLKSSPDTDNALKQYRHVLWRDSVRDPLICPALDLSVATPGDAQTVSSGTELMSENMRISNLAITQVSNTRDTYQVSVGLVYGDTDLLDYTEYNPGSGSFHLACKGGVVGTQFCALSEISTVVERRIK
jgi:prepilin-type N-terminal cleavage/methylation domain-containing protein